MKTRTTIARLEYADPGDNTVVLCQPTGRTPAGSILRIGSGGTGLMLWRHRAALVQIPPVFLPSDRDEE
jgi:hypothetical protein